MGSLRLAGKEHLSGVQVGPDWWTDAQRDLGSGNVLTGWVEQDLEYTLCMSGGHGEVFTGLSWGCKLTVKVCGWVMVAGVELCVPHLRLSYYGSLSPFNPPTQV